MGLFGLEPAPVFCPPLWVPRGACDWVGLDGTLLGESSPSCPNVSTGSLAAFAVLRTARLQSTRSGQDVDFDSWLLTWNSWWPSADDPSQVCGVCRAGVRQPHTRPVCAWVRETTDL